MTTSNKDHKDWLAAEFALGTLEGDDLATATRLYDTDLAFRHAVDEWQNDLSPMLDEVGETAPPHNTWEKIAARTGHSQKTAGGLWSSLAFWRLATGAMAAAALAIFVFTGPLAPPPQQAPFVAALTKDGAAPGFLVRFDPRSNQLAVEVTAGATPDGKDRELWIIPAGQKPISLGVMAKSGTSNVPVNAQLRARFKAGATLAISLEPSGGSPTGQPTGPVIASGKLRPL